MTLGMSGKTLIQVLGPTAVGKTDYAIRLATRYSSPVISCDSRQIFKEMRIGTAPPSEDQLRQVRHYFIFSHSVATYYSAGLYEVEAMELLARLFKDHDTLVMAGGPGCMQMPCATGLTIFPRPIRNSANILRTGPSKRVSHLLPKNCARWTGELGRHRPFKPTARRTRPGSHTFHRTQIFLIQVQSA